MRPAIRQSKTVTISIAHPAHLVYEFVADPSNLPRWASSFVLGIRKSHEGWVLETSDGEVGFRYIRENDLGVLDHFVIPAPGIEIYVPMRVVPNGEGSEVMLTLYRDPDTSYEEFAADAEMVDRDLASLKRLLEKNYPDVPA